MSASLQACKHDLSGLPDAERTAQPKRTLPADADVDKILMMTRDSPHKPHIKTGLMALIPQ